MEFFLLLLIAAITTASLVLVLIHSFKSWEKNEKAGLSIIKEELRIARDDEAKAARALRQEVTAGQNTSTETLVKTISAMGKTQADNLESVTQRIKDLTASNEKRLEQVRNTIDEKLKDLQENNEKKLDQMRQTVDEKLQVALEKRLGESFKIVSERLEAVQRGLGEMKNLATGVGDLKRVLTNVKTRGTWGEVQLGAILEQILTPEQYDMNVQTREGSREVVEYAIRLPGKNHEPESCLWLPIDSKFPQEDYQRLQNAADIADAEGVQQATAALVRTIQASAKDISSKYINPPKTTDFAILFLPTEGLYAEVLRQPGQIEELQQKWRVVVAGPTTLSAILNSLRMGFQTLAIQERSTEVWNVLAAVKTEFSKFGGVLSKVKKQLDIAVNTIEQTSVRTRVMARKLREVEQMPIESSEETLGLAGGQMNEVLDDESTRDLDEIPENDTTL